MAGVYFFLMPDECIEVLQRAAERYELWLAMKVHPVTKLKMARLEDVTPELLVGPYDHLVTLELGFGDLTASPIRDRRRSSSKDEGFDIDYEQSYNIRFSPSIMTPNGGILFQGSMLMLAGSRYPDHSKAKQLTSIFQALRREIRKR